ERRPPAAAAPTPTRSPTRAVPRDDEDEDTGYLRSNASFQSAAAAYESMPRTPGGTRTLQKDIGGYIFRPLVEAEVKPMPRGLFRGRGPLPRSSAPSSSASGSRSLAAALSSSAAPSASQQQVRPELDDDDEEDLPPASVRMPRIAWSEGPAEEGGDDDERNADERPSDMLEFAAQIRRDFLSRQLMEQDPSPRDSAGSGGGPQEQSPWSPRTEDAKKSLSDLEASLAKARSRSDSSRQELNSYMENLRSKTFQASDPDPSSASSAPAPSRAEGADEEEPLVSMPVDFDDVVDINASLASNSRRNAKPRGSAGRASVPSGAELPSDSADGTQEFRIPAFLEKYFYEDKAAEQLPIVQLRLEE
ncbi:unnamed protein product, partial [Polarella glacialis]